MARFVSSHNREDCTIMDSLVHTHRAGSNLGDGCFTNEEGRSQEGDDFVPDGTMSLMNRMSTEYYFHQKKPVANDGSNKKYTPHQK